MAREEMANYKVPPAVEIVDELPLNATGKVMKDVLRERGELVMMHRGLERAAERFGDRAAVLAGSDQWSFAELDAGQQRVRRPLWWRTVSGW